MEKKKKKMILENVKSLTKEEIWNGYSFHSKLSVCFIFHNKIFHFTKNTLF